MLLAGVMLKMGVLGAFLIVQHTSGTFGPQWLIAMFGSVAACGYCACQSDSKAFIAFSSVSHMNFTLAVLLTHGTTTDWIAFLHAMLHGLVSSAMFHYAGLLFHCSGTRMLYFTMLNNAIKYLPMAMNVLLLANCSVPPLGTSWPEIGAAVALTNAMWLLCTMLMAYAFLMA